MMGSLELAELVADIEQRGQMVPIVVHEGMILDGRNRYKACLAACKEPRIVEWGGEGGSPTAYVISLNLKRRHLDESERSMVAGRALPMFEQEARARQVGSLKHGASSVGSNLSQRGERGRSAEKAASLVNVSRSSVENAAKVLRDGAPELVAAVDRGEVSVSAAAALARKPKDEQVAVVSAGPKQVKKVAREIRDGDVKRSAEDGVTAAPRGEVVSEKPQHVAARTRRYREATLGVRDMLSKCLGLMEGRTALQMPFVDIRLLIVKSIKALEEVESND